jgi:hypothetical protein
VECADSPDDPGMMTVYQTLRQGVPGDHLLPNLEHLSWQHFESKYSSFIDLFLGPRIKSVSVREEDNGRCPGLAILKQRYPGLISVVIEEVNGDCEDAECGPLYDFVCTLTQAELIDVRILDSETLQYLGHLTTLKTLRTMLHNSVAFPGVADGSMFSNLRETRFRHWNGLGGGISALLALMRTWNAPQLESFDADVLDWSLEDVEKFYQVLASHCAHKHLKMLQVEFLNMEYPTPTIVIPGRFFRPLFDFTSLTLLNITVPAGYDLDDATVFDMARAWSNIEDLWLRSRSNHRPQCTLLSLECLARHCPRLSTVVITLDASSVSQAAIGVDQVLQEKLTLLNVETSRISDAAAVATFLSSLFPNLTQIMTDGGYLWEEGDTIGRQHYQRWMEVEQLIPGHKEIE